MNSIQFFIAARDEAMAASNLVAASIAQAIIDAQFPMISGVAA